MSVKESSQVKSKNLDVVAEFERSQPKNHANFIVIGRMDRFIKIAFRTESS